MALTDVPTTQDKQSVSDVLMLEAIPETADIVAPPDARHQPPKGRPAMLSNMTPIVELLLGTTQSRPTRAAASMVPSVRMASTVSVAW
jgi:hypothetical protein